MSAVRYVCTVEGLRPATGVQEGELNSSLDILLYTRFYIPRIPR